MTQMFNKDRFAFLVDEAQVLYKKSRDDSLDDFPEEERRKYHINGNRNDFEKLYFKRRDYLSATAVLALFDDSYIHEL